MYYHLQKAHEALFLIILHLVFLYIFKRPKLI